MQWDVEPMMSPSETPNMLLDELEWVHGLIRRDLENCRGLAADVLGGASADEVRANVDQLQTRGLLFQLRGPCPRRCQFVHAHHGHEDAWMFPAVLEFAPHFGAVVDKLEADHRRISEVLDAVESTSRKLMEADGPRQPLAGALDESITFNVPSTSHRVVGSRMNCKKAFPSAVVCG